MRGKAIFFQNIVTHGVNHRIHRTVKSDVWKRTKTVARAAFEERDRKLFLVVKWQGVKTDRNKQHKWRKQNKNYKIRTTLNKCISSTNDVFCAKKNVFSNIVLYYNVIYLLKYYLLVLWWTKKLIFTTVLQINLN